jgi:hypothetical protein
LPPRRAAGSGGASLVEAGQTSTRRTIDSAFLLAGARGYLEILRMTLKAGPISRAPIAGGTALIPACVTVVATVRELLTTRIDVDHVNNLGWTALLEAVILGDGQRTKSCAIVAAGRFEHRGPAGVTRSVPGPRLRDRGAHRRLADAGPRRCSSPRSLRRS